MVLKFDLSEVSEKQRRLESVKAQLKSEFFGMDPIIDRVMDSIYAWYLFPQLITRPVIVNLWGMTGVGKTQLVRRLTHLLEFYDRYVEIQMDGFSQGSGFHGSSISSILRQSSIEEGKPGILLLDEIQRFRTVDEHGGDVKVERYQDVWQLLSDGKFSADSSLFRDIEDMLAYQVWSKDREESSSEEEDDEDGEKLYRSKPKKPAKFSMGPWEANNLKTTLRLTESVQEIMTWSLVKVHGILSTIRSERTSWELDYGKLLVFVSGNLDEAFSSAMATDDCDTDADVYHEMTKKITIADIKSALTRRFRPEQVARLGNNHIIYPSLSKDSYQKLIRSSCEKYVSEMTEISGINFTLDEKLFKEIYDNAVYPTQGTRPVFSSTHKIFSTALSSMAVWAVENTIENIAITIDTKDMVLIGQDMDSDKTIRVCVDLDMRTTRAQNTLDFNTLVSVHEAGHALTYAVLFGVAPLEVKTNLASFKGGFMIHNQGHRAFFTKESHKDLIAVSFAGAAAEELVFGPGLRSNGCGSDVSNATVAASRYVRSYAFDKHYSLVRGDAGPDTTWNTDICETNGRVEALCEEGYNKALSVLKDHKEELKLIVNALLEGRTLNPESFQALMAGRLELKLEDADADYNAHWVKFGE